jgi:hypothetical protein
MYVNHDQADTVFDALCLAFRNRSFPYGESKTPQQIVFDSLSKYSELIRARYWFYVCMYMRGPVDSNYAALKLVEILDSENGGGIFDPSNSRSHNTEEIDHVMTVHNFTRLLTDVKKFWAFGSKKLAAEYNSDPRNIFLDVHDFQEIERRCRYVKKTKAGFMGFQKKMTSMLTYFLRDQNLIGLKDFPPPVDFHLMRVMILTGIVCLDESDPTRFRYETSSVLGYEAIEGYLARSGTDPIELGDALWLLSGNLCSISPKNKDPKSFGIYDQASIDGVAASKRKRLAAPPGLFDSVGIDLPLHVSSDTKLVRDTCGKCPARVWCNGGIPAVEYYAYGLLVLRKQGTIIW